LNLIPPSFSFLPSHRIPFYLSSRGYGVFINDPGEVELEVGSEKGARVGVITRGEEMEYYFINGPTRKNVLERYTRELYIGLSLSLRLLHKWTKRRDAN